MIRRPPRATRTDTLFPTRRSSDLAIALGRYADRAALVAIGIFHGIEDQFGDDHADRHGYIGTNSGFAGQELPGGLFLVDRLAQVLHETAPVIGQIDETAIVGAVQPLLHISDRRYKIRRVSFRERGLR